MKSVILLLALGLASSAFARSQSVTYTEPNDFRQVYSTVPKLLNAIVKEATLTNGNVKVQSIVVTRTIRRSSYPACTISAEAHLASGVFAQESVWSQRACPDLPGFPPDERMRMPGR